jgi:hypothetical protein
MYEAVGLLTRGDSDRRRPRLRATEHSHMPELFAAAVTVSPSIQSIAIPSFRDGTGSLPDRDSTGPGRRPRDRGPHA